MAYLADCPVPYSILYAPKSTESGDASGWRGTMTFRVAYSDRAAFLTFAAGTVETVGNTQRIVPLQHPEFPGMYAQRFFCENTGSTDTTTFMTSPMYSDSRITVEFQSLPYNTVGDNPYMTKRLKGGGRYISQIGNAFKFPSDNTPIKQDAGLFVPEYSYSLTFYQCSQINDDAFEPYIGKVNSDTFMGRPPGTVRFDSPEAEVVQTVTFSIAYTVTLNFTYSKLPHNVLMRPDGNLEEPVDIANGDPMYETTALTPLLDLVS